MSISAARRNHLLVAAAAAVGVALIWLPQLASDLWLDETGTYWVVKDGFSRAIDTGVRYHAQPLYYALAWIGRVILGTDEAMLRLPSLLAAAAAAFLLYRLGKTLFDAETGFIAAAVFVSFRDVAFAAGDARPYAMAMLTAVAGTLLLARWIEGGRLVDGAAYVAVTALMLHLHYLFGILVPIQLGYAWWRTWKADAPAGSRRLVYAALGIGALLAPGLPALLSFAARREYLANPASARPGALLVVPILLAAAAWGALTVRRRSGRSAPSNTPGAFTFVAVWAIVPPLLLYVISTVSSTNVFQARYVTSAAPGLALLVAATLRMLDPGWVRRATAVGLVAASVLAFGLKSDHWIEPWGDAADAAAAIVADAGTPVLVRSGYVEAADPSWLAGERADYLLAPLSYYPFPGRAVVLPFGVDASTTPYLERVASALIGRDDFLIVANYQDPFTAWFRERLASSGYKVTSERRFGVIWTTLFEHAG